MAGDRGRQPVHVVVAMGLGTGIYAFSLAAVTALQADTDRALIADREPVGAAIGILETNHDQLAANLELARQRYAAATDSYGALIGGLDNLHARLDALGASLQAVEGIAINAPRLPGVPVIGKGGSGTKTGSSSGSAGSGSGGSSGSGSGSSSGSGGTTVVPAPLPPVVAPPPVQATTGASGAP
jgi:uncharacterized membrane protein YgcG